jgi:beta-lactamase class D
MLSSPAAMTRCSVVAAASLLVLLFPTPALAWEPDFARLFAGRDGCFELYDLNGRKLVARHGSRRCAERTSPASTFKVPLALMAFESGFLADESSSMKWDGTDHGREEWNRDQTAASWMRDSVVWCSQWLASKLGMHRVKAFLAVFAFGNQDMSGGLTKAWLDSSLKISPDEELRFLERLWHGDFPVSKRSLEATKRIMLVEASPEGWTLHGKTGTGALSTSKTTDKGPLSLGWFVGHVGRGNREFVFVTSYSDLVKPEDDRPAGLIARELTKEILSALGFY